MSSRAAPVRSPSRPAPVDRRGAPLPEYRRRIPGPGEVRTPSRQVDGLRAGIVTRSLANAIDVVVVALVLAGGYAAVSAVKFLWKPRSFAFPEPGFTTALIVAGAVQGAYFALSWVAGGRTVGDQVLGVRVVAASGRGLRWWLAVVRACFCVVVPLGLVWVAVSRQNRSLQDVVLRTSVVYDWRHGRPEH
jgi:uncharacterized RDD family membrane protein YckC